MNIKHLKNKGKVMAALLIISVLGKYAYSSIISPRYIQQEDAELLPIEEKAAFEYIKNMSYEGMTLDEVLDTFQSMCQIPLGHDYILYEAGAYAFNLEPGFYVCLARQYRDSEGVSKQIHMKLKYTLDPENRGLGECVWNDELDEDIFSYIKRSETYDLLKDRKDFEITFYVD